MLKIVAQISTNSVESKSSIKNSKTKLLTNLLNFVVIHFHNAVFIKKIKINKIYISLVNEEDPDDEADYIIFDKNDLIGNQSTISHTLIPNLLIDASHTSYYDCAGFEDSRSVAHDISVTYLIRKLLNNVNSVKFLFTIPMWSVRVGGEKLEFKKLLRHATNLIIDIDRYKDSIALVVTKTDKPANRNKTNDDTKIKNVAKFLNDLKKDLEDDDSKEKKLKFIEALLKKKDDKYERIRIHRLVAETGPLKDMPVQEDEKRAIKNMVYQNIQYQNIRSDDFGYSISSQTNLQIVDLLEELQQQILNDVSDI